MASGFTLIAVNSISFQYCCYPVSAVLMDYNTIACNHIPTEPEFSNPCEATYFLALD